VLVLLFSLILAGCAAPSAQDPAAQTSSGLPAEDPPVDSFAPLAGLDPDVVAPGDTERIELNGTWRSTEVEGIDLDEDVRVVITFEEDRFRADIACNTMTGPYAIEGGRLEVVYESTTETAMGCPQPEASWDRWLLELLTSTPAIDQQDDTLTITGDPGRLVLTRQDQEASDEEGQAILEGVDATPSGEGVFPII
jgi:heat shock protein HslJ